MQGNPDAAATLPPEAILDPNVYPGACWPFQGTKGFVTLRLAQPIHFASITIDHAPLLSKLSSGSDASSLSSSLFSRGISSAPRHFQIIGYPPLTNHSSRNRNRNSRRDGDWGFDTTKGTILSMFEFDPSLPRSSSQTFERNVPDLPQEGSCSEVKPTCGEDGDDGEKKSS